MIKAKKSLGQNFLIDKNVINIITEIIDIENKAILEVGPGTGNLTRSLLQKKPKKFYVIEKDDELVIFLQKEFQNQVTIINDDVLKFDENLFSDEKLIVFGNLPYNISTEILCKWILNLNDKKIWFNNLILMFQKEVADRIISDYNSSKYGRLSILANWKLEIKKIIDIKPNSFSPKPKIESSLLCFSPKKNFFKLKNPYNLEKITRIFFNHRRKMIKKPFNQLFSGNDEILSKLNIDLNLRPQNLNFETYYKLTNEYEKLRS
ncbi:MAG: 16S rRNA (adenine(1518)-N(6)/adenine(1519)-N(6))-dimethyltransferase RsmA [Candidatus Pelagibacter sp.]